MAADAEREAAPSSFNQRDASVANGADPSAKGTDDGTDIQTLPLRPRNNDITTNGGSGQDADSQQSKQVNLEDQENALENQDHGIATNVVPTEEKKKRKKRNNRKPDSKRGLGKPTGFEDFFADAPITPEEHAEDQDLYDPKLHFVDRITTAVARFERTRKLTPERRDIFYKYLAYGGLQVGPKVGQGGVNIEGMTKTEVAQVQSQAFVSDDMRNLGTETSLYEVDFLGCMKGFLSRRAKYVWGLETKDQVERVCTTLERFMDYLLQHDVCSEFKDEILASRSLCRSSVDELWDVVEAVRRLPGDFNVACSTLFDGSYARNYDGETWWGREDEEGPVFVGLKPDEARQIVSFGIAGAAVEKVYLGFLEGVQNERPLMLDVINVEEQTGFEITHVEGPTAQCKEIYTSQSSQYRPVGRVRAKPWRKPGAPPEDLTPAEQSEQALSTTTVPTRSHTEYVFFIETILQSMLRVGTKVEATIRTLGCGIMFFDEVINVYPTFDEFLPNELMVDWKPPKALKGANDYVNSGEDSDIEEGDAEGEGIEANDAGAGMDSRTGERIGELAKNALAGVMAEAGGGAASNAGDHPY